MKERKNLVATKVACTLLLPRSLEGGVNGPVVGLLHLVQLVLITTEQLVGLGLNAVKNQVVVVLFEFELVEPPVASGSHGQEGTCSKLHCVNHELGFPEHCYCAMQYKTSLEYFSLVHCIAMIEYLYMDLKLSVAFCHFFDHDIALHNI